MLKTDKFAWVKEYKQKFESNSFSFVFNYTGLPAEELGALRGAIKAAGGQVCFVKNTLAKLAVTGTDSEQMKDLFKNVSVLVMSDSSDEDSYPSVVKSIFPFMKSRKDKLSLAGGVCKGKFLNKSDLEEFGNLPSREELYSRIAFLCQYPLVNVADTIKRASEK